MPSTATSILDGLSTSVAVKAPCRTVATSNITLAGLQTISGYTTVEDDRVLVKGQTNPVDNGIYMASTGNWTRAKDADGARDFVQGTLVLVRNAVVGGQVYELTTENPIVIGTTELTFEQRGFPAITEDDLVDGLDIEIRAEGFATDEPLSGSISRFYAKEAITEHAHYGFLDDSLIEYAGGAPIYGHASFADNVTFTGSVASDHHHSFQSYPHYDVAATITRIAGFYSIGDVTDGTVTSYAGVWVDDPTGAGTINNLYGVYIAPLDRGTGNSYAFFSEGLTKSCLGGPLQLGVPATPAIVQYNYDTGNLDLIPRADAGNAYNIFANAEYLYIGDASIGTAANLRNNVSTGDLEITARTGEDIVAKSPIVVSHPLELPAYTVAQLGSSVLPADWTNCICICSNETGGRTLVFSNGTNWKRAQDLANIS